MRIIIFAMVIALGIVGCSSDNKAPVPSVKNDEKCIQKPNPGKCRAAITKYYFDIENKKCKSFVWGGCGGVVPFDSMGECQSSCR